MIDTIYLASTHTYEQCQTLLQSAPQKERLYYLFMCEMLTPNTEVQTIRWPHYLNGALDVKAVSIVGEKNKGVFIKINHDWLFDTCLDRGSMEDVFTWKEVKARVEVEHFIQKNPDRVTCLFKKNEKW